MHGGSGATAGQPAGKLPGSFPAAASSGGGSSGLEGWASGGGSVGGRPAAGRSSLNNGAGSAFATIGDPLDWMGSGSVAGEDPFFRLPI